jgi:hypothetical protein
MKEAAIHFGWRPLGWGKSLCAGRYPVSAFLLIRPIRMVIAERIRMGLKAMKAEAVIPSVDQPKFWTVAVEDRNGSIWFSIWFSIFFIIFFNPVPRWSISSPVNSIYVGLQSQECLAHSPSVLFIAVVPSPNQGPHVGSLGNQMSVNFATMPRNSERSFAL